MTRIPRRRAARLAFGLILPTVLAVGGPANAQGGPRFAVQTQLILDGRSFSLSPRQAGPLTALRESIPGRRATVQDAALAAARAAADSPDSRYMFAVYALEIGKQRGDKALQAEALDIMIASGIPPRPKLASFLDVRGGIAFEAGDLAIAESAWRRLLEMRPGDPGLLVNLAQLELARKDPRAAGGLIQQAIAARKAAGQPAPELWYRQWLSIANQSGAAGEAATAGLALVSAYPAHANWHDFLLVYRQLAAPDGSLEIDLLRLSRAVGGFSKPTEYQRLAQLLEHAGLAAEAKAVLAEGLRSGLLKAGESPTREIIAEVERAATAPAGRLQNVARAGAADSLFASGRYLDAAALYRAELQGSGADSARLNTRLGMALAAAGRGGDAEAAFRAAAGDGASRAEGYAELARFWLAWLAQQGAAPRPAAA